MKTRYMILIALAGFVVLPLATRQAHRAMLVVTWLPEVRLTLDAQIPQPL